MPQPPQQQPAALPDGISLVDADKPLFADHGAILATLKKEAGAAPTVPPRVLDIEACGHTQTEVISILEALVKGGKKIGEKTKAALGTSFFLLSRCQLLVDVGIISNKQPMCHCQGEPKPMSLLRLGGGADAARAKASAAKARRAAQAKETAKAAQVTLSRLPALQIRASNTKSKRQQEALQKQLVDVMTETIESVMTAAVEVEAAAAGAADAQGAAVAPERETMYGSDRPKIRLVWKCNRKINKKTCGKKLSVLFNTILEGRNCTDLLVPIVYAFWKKHAVVDTAEALQCNKNTVTEVFDMLRECTTWVITGPEHPDCRPRQPHFKMGGRGVIVEIDEAKLMKRKYGRGRRGAAQRKGWVVGFHVRPKKGPIPGGPIRKPTKHGLTPRAYARRWRMWYERRQKQEKKRPHIPQGISLMIPIFHKRRNKATIFPLIRKYVRRGTLIMTDEARVYGGLKAAGYGHRRINHSYGQYVTTGWGRFTKTHTNTIEGAWKHLRKLIPHCGIKGGDRKYSLRCAERCYRLLLETHPKWKDQDPVKLILTHLGKWFTAGMPDGVSKM